MPAMKGGQAVVETLIREGVEVVFGIPGVHTLEIYDALYNRPQLRHIVTRHEQGAAFMADGYARASGKVGVVLSITGPGVTNASTGIGQAYADGSPLLVIASDVDSRHKGRGNLHELKDQWGMMRAITRFSARAESIAAIPVLIQQALREARGGWPGPTYVEIPIDVLGAEGMVELPQVVRPEETTADTDEVARAVALLSRAERPFIYAGWGVTASDANAELLELAQRFQAPVLTDPVGKGAIPEDHPLSLGTSWRAEESTIEPLARADVALAVGTRLGAMETRNGALPLPQHLIHIDPDPDNIGRSYPTEIGLLGHPKAVLRQLLDHSRSQVRASRAEEVAAVRASLAAPFQERSPEAWGFLSSLRQGMGKQTILSMDLTIPSYWASTYLPVYEARTLLNPYNFMALGFGLPAGIGAKIARPERPVVVLCGDGGFMFTGQELATAVLYGLDIVIVLCNNGGYGAIRRHQQLRYEGRVIDADLANPDFVRLAEAFGVTGIRLQSVGELESALRQAIEARGPQLIEVPTHNLTTPW